ncbi:hypothetical protein EVAR_31590_1 [Eumeta japonica]|uniref:Uncharacterized protein n=1 Tax=Eumeta variegata TaxID=151549 RepID=A0A4C1V840_EUMVA|nr:hypothetical protein EVAR_31590_1 [Eumeta japonica]
MKSFKAFMPRVAVASPLGRAAPPTRNELITLLREKAYVTSARAAAALVSYSVVLIKTIHNGLFIFNYKVSSSVTELLSSSVTEIDLERTRSRTHRDRRLLDRPPLIANYSDARDPPAPAARGPHAPRPRTNSISV